MNSMQRFALAVLSCVTGALVLSCGAVSIDISSVPGSADVYLEGEHATTAPGSVALHHGSSPSDVVLEIGSERRGRASISVAQGGIKTGGAYISSIDVCDGSIWMTNENERSQMFVVLPSETGVTVGVDRSSSRAMDALQVIAPQYQRAASPFSDRVEAVLLEGIDAGFACAEWKLGIHGMDGLAVHIMSWSTGRAKGRLGCAVQADVFSSCSVIIDQGSSHPVSAEKQIFSADAYRVAIQSEDGVASIDGIIAPGVEIELRIGRFVRSVK